MASPVTLSALGQELRVTYSLRLTSSARRSLALDLPEAVAAAAWQFVDDDLRRNPQRVEKPLRFNLEGRHSACRGVYRVIYRILADEVMVEVVRISHHGAAHT